jgi:hypothetical protein
MLDDTRGRVKFKSDDMVPVLSETRSPGSRRVIVVPQEAAQTVAATNSGTTTGATTWCNQIVAQALMIPFLMVVHHELLEHVP